MGGSSGGTGPDSTKLGKIDPPMVARPYIPHEAVNHALPGNWRPGLMAPHGTTDPQPYTDTQESVQQAMGDRQARSLMFANMLRELGIGQQTQFGAGLGQPNYQMPSNLPFWTPPPPPPPKAPLSPAGPSEPFQINA